MWNKIVVVVSAVNDGCSFELGNNRAIVTVIPFLGFRALLSCGTVCCILSSGFTFDYVGMKSVVVLLYSYQQLHYKLLLIILATLRNKKDKLMYSLIETFVT